jgi:hypothetical protein
MNRYFLIDKRDGRTRAICDGEIEFDKNLFELIKIDITKKQEEDIKQGKQKAIIKDKKLTLEDF